jgi:hypothetical protein
MHAHNVEFLLSPVAEFYALNFFPFVKFCNYYAHKFVRYVFAAAITLAVFCKSFTSGIPLKFWSIIFLFVKNFSRPCKLFPER